MNPRYRRALVPSLLVALLAVVVVASLAGRARGDDDGDGYVSGGDDSTGPAAASTRVSVIRDERIDESSGLAVSSRDPRLAYTVNDSGNDAVVYVVEVASGDVVGETRLDGEGFDDVEALALDGDGTLWVGDTGDNQGDRDDVSVYAMPEPRRGDRSVEPRRYRLAYPRGAREDAEALLADPTTGRLSLVTKGFLGGALYRLPSDLSTRGVNRLRPVAGFRAPTLVTDGSFTPDGSVFLLRSYVGVHAYDARTLRRTWSAGLPDQPQGETLAVERGGRSALVGTEGSPSPLDRIDLGGAEPERRGLAAVGGVVNAAR